MQDIVLRILGCDPLSALVRAGVGGFLMNPPTHPIKNTQLNKPGKQTTPERRKKWKKQTDWSHQ